MKRTVTRWEAQQLVAEYMKQLRQATLDAAHIPDQIAGETGVRPSTLEQDWRRDAEGAGLSPPEIEESWVWFRESAFEGPPVLEETEQRTARETMPESVRRVLKKNPLYGFVGYDPDLLDDLGLSIKDDAQAAAEDQLFWDDIGYAFADPRDRDARKALDRIGKLVHLHREHVKQLATQSDRLRREAGQKGTSTVEERRRLIQEAILLSLGVAEERVRVGRRKISYDPGHPITLQDIFGASDLKRILDQLAEVTRDPIGEVREKLERSLGAPYSPARLAHRNVYRNWLTEEIRRRTVELLEHELGIVEADRAGGSRRKDVSYDETEPLPGGTQRELGSDTREHAEQQMRAA